MNDIRDGHYTLGKAYLNAEQYDEAIEQLEKVVSVDADFIEGYHALALAYFGQHRLQDAKDAALEALKIDATQNIASIRSMCSNPHKHKGIYILYYACPVKRMRTYIKQSLKGCGGSNSAPMSKHISFLSQMNRATRNNPSQALSDC